MRQALSSARHLSCGCTGTKSQLVPVTHSKRVRLWPVAGVVFLTAFSGIFSHAQKETIAQRSVLYVQTSKGSFNHQAIDQLNQHEGHVNTELKFSGTPASTFENAATHKKEAFVALRNDLVPGNLIKQTVQAMTRFQVVGVTGAVKMPISMCLLRSTKAVETGVPLKFVSSHPAALLQVSRWVKRNNLEEIPDIIGTASAAYKVADGTLSGDVGAIGSCLLAQTYKELIVIEENFQNDSLNTTLFGRVVVRERSVLLSEEQAASELETVIAEAEQVAVIVFRKNTASTAVPGQESKTASFKTR